MNDGPSDDGRLTSGSGGGGGSAGGPCGRGSGGGGSGSGMSVTVLGTSGSYPGPGSACSGYLVRHRGFNLWLDAGPGTMANLQTHVGLAQVDAIVLSHQHPDHWSDLDGFFVACRYVETRARVPVYAPAGLRDLMRTGPDNNSTFAWHDVTDKTTVSVGPLRLRFSRTDHPPETLAVRVDTAGSDSAAGTESTAGAENAAGAESTEGAAGAENAAGAESAAGKAQGTDSAAGAAGAPTAFGYSADTGPGWSLEALGTDLDLAICEATFLRDREGTSPHLSARQAGAMARAARVRRLLITHLWPIVDPVRSAAEASEAFGAPVECAQMNATYQL